LRACIAGFHLCSLADDAADQYTPTSSAHDAGALLYQAPELLNGDERRRNATDSKQPNIQDTRRKTLASDIYAFGCVCHEVSAFTTFLKIGI
jgi:serine/threonine protein kinase